MNGIIGQGLTPPLESLMIVPELFVFTFGTHQRRRFTLLIGLGVMLFGWSATGHATAADVALRLSTFRVDVTPPMGDGPCVGCMPKVASIEHPLELRGIVLRADERTFVIAAIDYCGICNTSDETIRGAMAQAAGTTIDQVALQSLHQHSAPILDADAVRFLHGEKSEQLAQHLRFTNDIASRTATAIADSLKLLQPVTRIVGSKAKVDRVASNRRVPQTDGSIAVRGSVTREAAVRNAPEGLIDPWLRTLTFFDGERKLVQLHYYATHPQTFYGDARISWDSVGMARERMQNATGTFQIYFTGCGGNVTVGKYNDGNHASREQLVTRLLDAMRRSDAVSSRQGTEGVSAERVLEVDGARLKHTEIAWDSAPIKFTVREEGTFNPELLKMQLGPDQPFQVRLTAAMFSGFGQRLREGYVARATRLRIGGIDIAHLPGEPFVEFQLFAQQVAAKNSFTCVAGYGECGVWYYGPDHIFTDRGGYEQTWSLTGPCQRTVEEALTTLLVREPLADEQELATQGKTPFVIVTPAKPLPEEVTAADWLATTLKQITGASFPILAEDATELPKTMLLVGDTGVARRHGIEAKKLQPEEWRIKSVAESLILAGGRPRGTVYAVCEFLEEQCGVLRLDPFTAVVPSQPTLTIPAIDRSGRPAFPLRMLFTGFPYGHPAGGGPLIEQYRIANKNNINGRVTSGDHARMIPTGVHTFGEFISSKEFAATHPEYFGMDASGRRLTDDMGTPSAWTQLCVTNDDVRRITLERAKKFVVNERAAAIKEGREPSRMLVLSQNDNTANLCLCPNCKAVADREGSESGPQLEFVNHVARGLKDEFPDVLVQTEAYNFTLAAPKTVRPEANVVVRFCDNYGFSDLTHPLAHPRNERPMKLFASWQEKQCKLGVWDYWRVFNQHPPGFFAPSSNVRALCDDIRMFHKAGVELMTIEAEDLFGASIVNDPISADMQSFMPLRTWIGMKLIDNPHKDLDSLLDTFCRGYYGPASKPMRALLERIEDRQTALPIRIVDVQRHVWAEQLCDAAFFADAYLWLDEAMLATAADPSVQTHIQRERIIIDSAFLWLEEHVRRRDPVRAASFPKRADVLKRHRADWYAYIATVFDADGLKLALPIIDAGISLAERIHSEDTLFEHVALGINESDVKLDGQLTEPFWQQAKTSRMLPRDPQQPNDDPTSIRLAWTVEALYVGIEQPADKASATMGITLMRADRQGIQLSLYAPKNNGPQALNPYFYDYDPNGGLRIVSGRKSQSQSVGAITDVKVTTELRFLWSDIAVSVTPNAAGNANRDFVFNIESYLKPDSKVPSHVSSPWLVGTQPNWHSGYYRSLRLANQQAEFKD